MDSSSKTSIQSAIVTLLRPLVRVLLRNGIGVNVFSELARWVYVDVASREFGIPGRKQTTSRVATITGLTRKDVKRLKELLVPDNLGSAERYNRAARVISGWLKDRRFSDGKGIPRTLSFDGDGSFSSLVKAYSGDVPPRAILDEMLRVGVVGRDDAGIRLLARGYVIKRGDIEKLAILGTDVSELISTIDHNISHSDETFLQRKVFYDNIPDDAIAELRTMILSRGQEFIESVDRLLAQYDRDMNPSLKGDGKQRAGLGIFYFE